MNVVSLKGYHGTCSLAKESIRTRGLDPAATKPRKDHWLGMGVYFFEDMGQAMWWAVDISRKKWNETSYPVIYEADIVADEKEVLNLDNNKEIAAFFAFIHESREAIETMCKEENIGYPVFTDSTLRGVLLDYYKKEFGIKVVICTFTKNYVRYVPKYPTEQRDIDFQKGLARSLGVYFKEKQLCVSDKSCIKNVSLVYDGEESEVI